jgi:1-acyl-sn-glycerol-3-phosphate acyltransferase
VDYSKYLGPNYEKTYDKSGVYIVNHTTFYEVTLSMYLMGPLIALLGKKEVTVIPGIRQIAFAVDNILVGRDTKDPKEVRLATLKTIEDRQIAAEKGLNTPLFLCPEGATTNGRYLI